MPEEQDSYFPHDAKRITQSARAELSVQRDPLYREKYVIFSLRIYTEGLVQSVYRKAVILQPAETLGAIQPLPLRGLPGNHNRTTQADPNIKQDPDNRKSS